MIKHTYFDKNNTLVRHSLVNTANNPISELFYGGDKDNHHDDIVTSGCSADTSCWSGCTSGCTSGGLTNISRYIFHFNESELIRLHEDGTYPNLSDLTHTLRMTNTTAFDSGLIGGNTPSDKQRTTSFDLITFKLNQDWDAGCGYDYQSITHLGDNLDNPLSYAASNWVNADTIHPWSGGSGVYESATGIPSGVTISTQHFDVGNEDIEMDITEAVNEILTGGTNYGFGVAFSHHYETKETTKQQYVGFYTNATQTFYEPYIETKPSTHIKDDRATFYKDKPNKLYLYVNLGNNLTDLDNIPTVNVYDNNDTLFSAYTSSAVTHVTKGVYSIEIMVNTIDYGDCVMFYDRWSNISINGIQRPDIELDFVLMDSFDYYNLGSDDFLPEKFGLSLHGVQRNEKIKRGDIRKVVISARIPFTVNQTKVIDNLEYRLYIKEGPNEYTVIDYTPVEMAFSHNFFMLDSGSMIPNTYYLDIKLKSNSSVETYQNVINFDIVSNVNDRRDI